MAIIAKLVTSASWTNSRQDLHVNTNNDSFITT